MRQVQRRVWVSGRVQGVGFRASTVQQAHRLDPAHELKGHVRNLADGRVEAVFSGPEPIVLAMVAWCRQGPPSARVDRLEVEEVKLDPDLPLFGVRRE